MRDTEEDDGDDGDGEGDGGDDRMTVLTECSGEMVIQMLTVMTVTITHTHTCPLLYSRSHYPHLTLRPREYHHSHNVHNALQRHFNTPEVVST